MKKVSSTSYFRSSKDSVLLLLVLKQHTHVIYAVIPNFMRYNQGACSSRFGGSAVFRTFPELVLKIVYEIVSYSFTLEMDTFRGIIGTADSQYTGYNMSIQGKWRQ